MPRIEAKKLQTDECDLLQYIVENPAWEVLKTVKNNINWERNNKAHAFCDGRSFVEFKKMDGVDEFIDIIEEIVSLHKKNTNPVSEPQERPRKLEEYVPR